LGDGIDPDHALPDGFGHGGPQKEGRYNENAAQTTASFGERTRGDDGRDVVGGIVKSIQEVEGSATRTVMMRSRRFGVTRLFLRSSASLRVT
jgi:hypothetical protein